MGDQHVGFAREGIDCAVERIVRLRDELHVELREVLHEVRHPGMNRAREVRERNAYLARMRLGIGFEFLVSLEGRVLACHQNDGQIGGAADGAEVLGLERIAVRCDVGLQNHRPERSKVDARTVRGPVVDFTRSAAH